MKSEIALYVFILGLSCVFAIPPRILVSKYLGEFKQTGFYDNPVRFSARVEGIAIDPVDGRSLFIADSLNNCIRRYDRFTNSMSTVVGSCTSPNDYVDGASTVARFNLPLDVKIQNGTGNIFIRDNGNNCLRMFNVASRKVETYLGICSNNTEVGRGYRDGQRTTAFLNFPSSYYPWRDQIIVLDSSNMCIRKVDTKTGIISQWIGLCGFYGATDGSFANARLGYPFALAVDDKEDNMFLTDAGYHCVRKIDLIGQQVSTYAGVCGLTNNGHQDGPAAQAKFFTPIDIIYDTGNLIITEVGTYCLRRISINRIVSTYAGMCGYYGTIDGEGTNAVFTYPSRMVLEKSTGNIFLTDSGNSVIRLLTPTCPSYTIFNRTSYDCQCVSGYGGASCTYCTAGTFKNFVGSDECLSCPLGTESMPNRFSCVDCAPGYYRNSITMANCLRCPSFSNCDPVNGFQCMTGYQYDTASGACVGIPKVTSLSSTKTSTSSLDPKPSPTNSCPKNAYCSRGIIRCNVGYEFSDGDSICTMCIPGFYSIGSGNSLNRCLACPSENSIACLPSGFTCASGFSQDFEKGVCSTAKAESNVLIDLVGGNWLIASALVLLASINMFFAIRYCLKHCKRRDPFPSSARKATAYTVNSTSYALGTTVTNSNQSLNGSRQQLKPSHPNEIYRSGEMLGSQISIQKLKRANSEDIYRAEKINSHNPNDYQLNVNLEKVYRSAELYDEPTTVTKVQRASTVTTTTTSGYETQGVLAIPGFLQFLGEQHFKMGEKIGQGAGGSIFMGQALHPDLGGKSSKIIAIKHFERPETQTDIDIFHQEVSIMYMLKEQRHIVKLIGYSTKPYYSILMKYYPTGSLESFIQAGKYINCKSTILVFLQDISNGVKLMHKNGIGHCDLKLSNILLDVDKAGSLICVITDFGVSRVTSSSAMKVSAFRTVNRRAASVPFASPETLKNMKNQSTVTRLDPLRADVFSLAMIIYCLITNQTTSWQ